MYQCPACGSTTVYAYYDGLVKLEPDNYEIENGPTIKPTATAICSACEHTGVAGEFEVEDEDEGPE